MPGEPENVHSPSAPCREGEGRGEQVTAGIPRSRIRWIAPALVLSLGLAARLAPWPHVFAGGGVRLRADTDPHYHVLRAERLLTHAPGAPWIDPKLGWPLGAEIPWPPLFDAAIAAGARLVSASPSRDQIAAAGSLLVVVLGLLSLPLLASLCRRLTGSRDAGWLAAGIAALVPAIVQHSEVGRVDQHAAELLLFATILLAFAAALQDGARTERLGILLGVAFAVSFWTWLGSAALLAFPTAFAVIWYVVAPPSDGAAIRGAKALAVGGAVGVLLLAVTIGAFGPPGALRRATLLGVSSLHLAIVAGVGATGGLMLAARLWLPFQTSPTRRALVASAAIALPMAAMLGLSDALREGAGSGLTALLAGNPWYASVGEFEPLLFAGDQPLAREVRGLVGSFGLTVPVALLAIPAWRSQLRRRQDRWKVAVQALLLISFVGLAFARQRFMGYAMIPLAIADAAGLEWLAERLPARLRAGALGRRAIVAVGLGIVVAPSLPLLGMAWSSVSPGEEQALRWLASAPRSAGREGVMAEWSMGHAVQYFAGRPVVASPFGTEGGVGSMDRWARFWFATDQSAAESALEGSRASVVVLGNPTSEAMWSFGLAPPGTPPAFEIERDPWNGPRSEMTAAASWYVVFRLYFMDGKAFPGGAPALDAFRLEFESPSTGGRPDRAESQVKIFEHVPGLRLTVTGVKPDADVTAVVHLTTNQGRAFDYGIAARASAEGTAVLRLPYGTGRNGLVEAEPWTVASGRLVSTLVVPADAVSRGDVTTLSLGEGR